jgi:hypothetical protein
MRIDSEQADKLYALVFEYWAAGRGCQGHCVLVGKVVKGDWMLTWCSCWLATRYRGPSSAFVPFRLQSARLGRGHADLSPMDRGPECVGAEKARRTTDSLHARQNESKSAHITSTVTNVLCISSSQLGSPR